MSSPSSRKLIIIHITAEDIRKPAEYSRGYMKPISIQNFWTASVYYGTYLMLLSIICAYENSLDLGFKWFAY